MIISNEDGIDFVGHVTKNRYIAKPKCMIAIDPLDVPHLEHNNTDSLLDLIDDSSIVLKIKKHGLDTLEDLKSFMANGNNLKEIDGIGEATESKIMEALNGH